MKNNPFGFILNSKVTALNMKNTVNNIEQWIQKKEKHNYICICNTHSLVTASKDMEHNKALSEASICTPDGMPLVWALKRLGFKKQERVDGPNLMLNLCEEATKKGYKIFLYGGTEESLNRLVKKLQYSYMGINIVGTYSPPFSSLSDQELEGIRNEINKSQADLVFVSLGCPKQEKWMYENSPYINSVLLGVGAAFNFIIGDIKRPPLIFQKLGLEWIFRLIAEPNRLWKRYLYNNTLYIYKYIKGYKIDKKNTIFHEENIIHWNKSIKNEK